MNTPDQSLQTKRCAKCKQDKPLKEFGTYKRSPDGKRWECKQCRKDYYETNKDTILPRMHAANMTPEQKARKAKKNARHFQKHRDRILARQKRYNEEHAEEYKLYFAQYHETHKKERNAQKSIYRKEHPEIHILGELRRRARKHNAPVNDLSREQWHEILIAFDFRCAYCPDDCWRCRRKKHKLTQDHVTPYAQNGSHTLSNVVPACGACNSRKGPRNVLRPVQPLLLTIAPSKPLKKRQA